MPTILGSPLYDSSSAALNDSNGDALGEADLPVLVSAGGILVNAMAPGIGQLVAEIAAAVLGLVVDDLLNGDDTVLTNINTKVNAIAPDADFAANEIGDPEAGLNAIKIALDGGIEDIRADIAALEPGGGLTTEEHDHLIGLVNADGEQIAGDVWGFTIPQPDAVEYDEGPMAQTVLNGIADMALEYAAYTGLVIPDRPHFRYLTKTMYGGFRWRGYWTNQAATADVPILDLTLVEDGDTVYTFLTREYPSYAWTQQGPGSWPTGGAVYLVQQANVAYYRCTLTDADLRSNPVTVETTVTNTTVQVTTAPLWPGGNDVVLGTPVPLADQLVVNEPMHGVIVTVTTPPTKTGLRMVGGQPYDYSVGEISFGTDEGDLEPWQYLGFRSAIFTPKSMAQAETAHFRVLAGAAGTVTPWRIATPA